PPGLAPTQSRPPIWPSPAQLCRAVRRARGRPPEQPRSMRAARPAAGADETELSAPQKDRRINAVQESIPAVRGMAPPPRRPHRMDSRTTDREPVLLSRESVDHLSSSSRPSLDWAHVCLEDRNPSGLAPPGVSDPGFDLHPSAPGFMNHRAPANGRYKPTCYEHAANCYTHAFLIVPAIVGSALLHRLSDDCWEKITAWIYGMGLCALFIVSTVFHIVSWKKSHLRTVEHCFHMCDRMVIYFFIAASYAPWLNLRELGPLASHMRWFIWLMAAGGTIYVFLYHEKYKVVELFFYLTMGFSPALVVTSMNNTDGLHELAFGGLIYCLGVVFFKSDGIIPFAHAIWHLFVATAAAVHYYAIWKYLYRTPTDFMRHL
ncbi:Monocyte to macrophage differentiation factor, partial [Galemys pyrenaicus]